MVEKTFIQEINFSGPFCHGIGGSFYAEYATSLKGNLSFKI